jgi:hypothetical protein
MEGDMKTFAQIAVVACLYASSVSAAADPFLMVTITDIGQPYKVIDGGCAYSNSPDLFDKSASSYFQSAFFAAAKMMEQIAKAHGADAVVGMTVTPLAAVDPLTKGFSLAFSGVNVCGTFVKLGPK